MDEFKILRRKAMTSAKSTLRLIQRESLADELTDVVNVCKDSLDFLDKEGGMLPNSQMTRQTMTLLYDAFGRINEPLRKRASTSWIRSKPKKLDKRAIYQQKNSIDQHLQKLRRLARRRSTSQIPSPNDSPSSDTKPLSSHSMTTLPAPSPRAPKSTGSISPRHQRTNSAETADSLPPLIPQTNPRFEFSRKRSQSVPAVPSHSPGKNSETNNHSSSSSSSSSQKRSKDWHIQRFLQRSQSRRREKRNGPQTPSVDVDEEKPRRFRAFEEDDGKSNGHSDQKLTVVSSGGSSGSARTTPRDMRRNHHQEKTRSSPKNRKEGGRRASEEVDREQLRRERERERERREENEERKRRTSPQPPRHHHHHHQPPPQIIVEEVSEEASDEGESSEARSVSPMMDMRFFESDHVSMTRSTSANSLSSDRSDFDVITPRPQLIEQNSVTTVIDSSTHQIHQDVLMYRNLFYRHASDRGLTREAFSEQNRPLEEKELIHLHRLVWRELQHLRISPKTFDAQLLSYLGFDAHNETYQGYGVFFEISNWNSQVSRAYNESVLEKLYANLISPLLDSPQSGSVEDVRSCWIRVMTEYEREARGPWKLRVMERFKRLTWQRDISSYCHMRTLFKQVDKLKEQITHMQVMEEAHQRFAPERRYSNIAPGCNAPPATPAVTVGNGNGAPMIQIPNIPSIPNIPNANAVQAALHNAFAPQTMSNGPSHVTRPIPEDLPFTEEDPITPLSPASRNPSQLFLEDLEEADDVGDELGVDEMKSMSDEDPSPWSLVERGLPSAVKEHMEICEQLEKYVRSKYRDVNGRAHEEMEDESKIESRLDYLNNEYAVIDDTVDKQMGKLERLRENIARDQGRETAESALIREKKLEKLTAKFLHERKKIETNLRTHLDTLVVVRPTTPRESLMACPPTSARDDELLMAFGNEIERLTGILNDNWMRLDEIENSDLSNVDNVYAIKSKLKVIEKLMDGVEEGLNRVKKNLDKVKKNENVQSPLKRVLGEQVDALNDRFMTVDDRCREAGAAVDRSLISLKSDEGLSDDEEEHYCDGEVVFKKKWRHMVVYYKKKEIHIYRNQEEFAMKRDPVQTFRLKPHSFAKKRATVITMGDGLETVEFEAHAFTISGVQFYVRNRDELRFWRSYVQTGINVKRENERWERKHSVSDEDTPRLMTSRRVRSHSAADLLEVSGQSDRISLSDLQKYAGYR